MKVELHQNEAVACYQPKGMSVSYVEAGNTYALSRLCNSELKRVFFQPRDLTLMIPAVVDYLAGGGFVDPLRMTPTHAWREVSDNVAEEIDLFDSKELKAGEIWATVGRFWMDGREYAQKLPVSAREKWESARRKPGGDTLTNYGPIFMPTKMGKAHAMLICGRWNRQTALKHVGLETEANLQSLLQRKGLTQEILYFNIFRDTYSLKGVDCFVIPLDRKHEAVRKWLDFYREQKIQLIKFSEREHRFFKWQSGKRASQIWQILPSVLSSDIYERIWRDRGGTKDEIVVSFANGTETRYRCDLKGVERAWKDYCTSPENRQRELSDILAL